MKEITNIFIFNVYRHVEPYLNENRHNYIKESLIDRKIHFKEVRGKYLGKVCKSFIIENNKKNKKFLDAAMDLFCQESYLVQKNKGEVYLHIVEENKEEYLGKFKWTKEEPKNMGWTYDPKEYIYYYLGEDR
jgi:hypothetical protein